MTGAVVSILGGMNLLEKTGVDLPALDPYAAEPWQVTNADGPVLLLINEDAAHPFGRFLAEILYAEGLNAFTAARLADASSDLLAQFPCVVVSAGYCPAEQVEMLAGYAAGGGNLVVFQPEDVLAERLGLGASLGGSAQGTLRVNPGHALARGIVTQPIAVHTACRWYPGEDSEALAWLDREADMDTLHPAVLAQRCGAGMLVAWAYDLAENIVMTRQGNPANVGRFGQGNIFRPLELFKGWINFEQMAYAQADEQQRLLANILTWLCRGRTPLPRLWYFPGKARCLLLATSDSHRNTSKALSHITKIVEDYQGRLTINYNPPVPSDLGILKNRLEAAGTEIGLLSSSYFPTPAYISSLRASGHEITLHPYVSHNYVEDWRLYWKAFARMGYGTPTATARTHELNWLGWSDAARFQASFGLRMNSDYYHYGELVNREAGVWGYGHFNGSGLPMRFANIDGRILEIYQQVTQCSDEHFIELPWTSSEHMGPHKGAEITRGLMQSSLRGNFAAIACNFHADPYDMEDRWMLPAQTWLVGTLTAANDLGIPIWTMQNWLVFVSGRQAARFERLRWEEKTLAFELNAESTSEAGLSVMIPHEHEGAALHLVRVDGETAMFEAWQVGGVEYGLVSLAPGSHRIEAQYL